MKPDDIKDFLIKARSFQFKAQILMFLILISSIYFMVFFAAVTLVHRILLSILFMCVIFVSGTIYLESKKNKEVIEDFILFYGMNKIKEKKNEDKNSRRD